MAFQHNTTEVNHEPFTINALSETQDEVSVTTALIEQNRRGDMDSRQDATDNAAKDDWQVPPSDVELGKLLGEGRFGFVFLSVVRVDAMKKRKDILKKLINDENEKEIVVAVKMMNDDSNACA